MRWPILIVAILAMGVTALAQELQTVKEFKEVVKSETVNLSASQVARRILGVHADPALLSLESDANGVYLKMRITPKMFERVGMEWGNAPAGDFITSAITFGKVTAGTLPVTLTRKGYKEVTE